MHGQENSTSYKSEKNEFFPFLRGRKLMADSRADPRGWHIITKSRFDDTKIDFLVHAPKTN